MPSPEVVDTGAENDGNNLPEISATIPSMPLLSHVVSELHSHCNQSSSPSNSISSAASQNGCVTPVIATSACNEHIAQISMNHSMLHEEAIAPPELAYTEPESLLHQLINGRINEPIIAHIFSGKAARPDGFAALVVLHGRPCLEIDTLIDPVADMLGDIFAALCRLAERGLILFALIGIPCNTWSAARVGSRKAPFQLRSRFGGVHGIKNLTAAQKLEVELADELGRRAFAFALILERLGLAYIFEHPIDRGKLGAVWFQPKFKSHVSIFEAEYALAFRKLAATDTLHFAQCACGSVFQKRTTLLFASRLDFYMSELRSAQCTHVSHARLALGFDELGESKSAESAAYPAGLNAIFAGIAVAWCDKINPREARGVDAPLAEPQSSASEGLCSGSAKPHADAAQARKAMVCETNRVSSSSLRRLEPELQEVLQLESLPVANIMPLTVAPPPPVELRTPPEPLTTDELIPKLMQAKLHQHRVRVSACVDRAERGGWKWARDHRPADIVANEAEALLPAGWGWKWEFSKHDLKWHAILPSRWPERPPDTAIDIPNLLEWAARINPRDAAIVAHMSHGYPGPELEPVAVVGSLHVGALKEMANFNKCIEKDMLAGIGRRGTKLPQIWPSRVDYRNVVMRRDSARVTIDKTIQLAPDVTSHNDAIDLAQFDPIVNVTVGQLGRARAILLTAGVEVKPFSFDLKSYFRVTGKNKSSWWMAGYIGKDGYGVDTRVQFGDRSAPVLCGRQSALLAYAIKLELRRLDLAYPSHVQSVLDYAERRINAQGQNTAPTELDFVIAALFFFLIYVDDGAGWILDDDLYDKGVPLFTSLVDEHGTITRVPQRRPEMYLAAAMGTVEYFGHSIADGKTWVPRRVGMMPFLGVSMDCERECMLITREKRDFYAADIKLMLGEQSLEQLGGIKVCTDELNSVIHKLLHAATCIVLGRQYVHHLLRCLRHASGSRLGAILGAEACAELEWWLAQLRKTDSEGVPMASRQVFPSPGPDILMPYSDASRELKSPQSSGFGAWAIIGADFCYVEGRWLAWELERLSINVLELAARNIGTFTFLEHAEATNHRITHLYEFTDNRAAEFALEFGKPKAPEMQALTQRSYDELFRRGVFNSMQRVASVDNDIADGLSRGGKQLANALRIAAGAGLPLKRLQPLTSWRDLSHLQSLSAAQQSIPSASRG